MRTTITLEPETQALVEKAMTEQHRSFKEVVNEAIQRGLGGARGEQGGLPPPHDAGRPLVNLTKAVQLAGDLEDQELMRKMLLGK